MIPEHPIRNAALLFGLATAVLLAPAPLLGQPPTDPLQTAIENGNLQQVTEILASGTDPNTDLPFDSALMLAASEGHLDIMTALIDAGADIDHMDSIGRTALMKAIDSRQQAAVRLLLDAGADPDTRKVNSRHVAIHRALSLYDLDIIRMLIAAGANVNSSLSNGFTPLMWAASSNNTELMELLLDAGANTESRMLSSASPTFADQPLAPTTLLAGGASGSGTALGKAALAGNIETTLILIEAGANLEARQFGGHSALTIAAEFGHAALVGILLEAGADRDHERDDGMTAFLLAQRNSHDDVIEMITRY